MEYYAAKINEKGTIGADDLVLVKGVECCAGSYMLDGFKPLFSAEAIDRLEKGGYKISGKTHVGEFSLDLVGEFSHYNKPGQILQSASAKLVADGEVEAVIGVDANGSPRRGAALSGVSFLKPTYGTVSRYGIVSTATSGEGLGVYAKDAAKIAEIMTVIAGHDDKDGTSLPDEKYCYGTNENISGKKIAIVKELVDKADDATKAKVKAFADSLTKKGAVVEEISLDMFALANIAWQIIMTAETCNNISRYDGVKYGHRAEKYKNIDELYVNSRTEGFNFLTKAVILYGSDVLSKNRYAQCYDKSLRIRRVIMESFGELMTKYDALLTPVCSASQYESYDIDKAFEKVFEESEFTALANLIGVPALSTGGVQLITKHFGDSLLLSLANAAKEVR